MQKEYLYVIFAALTWSSFGIFVRLTHLSGLEVFFFIALISAMIFALLLIREKGSKAFEFLYTKKQLGILVIMSIAIVVNNVSYFYAFSLATIANATFVHYLAPVMVALLAPFAISERTDRKVWLSIILSLAGMFILARPSAAGTDGKYILGLLLAFLSAVAYAITVLYNKKALKQYSTNEIIFFQMVFSVLVLLPFIIYLRPILFPADILPLLVMGIFHQGIALILILKALSSLPAPRVSTITYLEPVGATILAIIFLGEIPALTTIIGGSLILASCYLTIRE